MPQFYSDQYARLLNITQSQIHSLPNGSDVFDVIIIGAGPSGATAARDLGRKGHNVLLIDRDVFPRDKVCGDGLNSFSVRFLKNRGLFKPIAPVGYPVKQTRVYSPTSRQYTIPGDYFTLQRTFLDTYLVQEACKTGVLFAQGTVLRASLKCDGAHEHAHVVVGPPHNERVLRAKACLFATGVSLNPLRRSGFITPRRASAIAARCYIQSTFHSDELIGAFHPSVLPGYGWIFPLGNQIYNVGVICYPTKSRPKRNLATVFRKFMRAFRPARNLLVKGDYLSPLRAGTFYFGLKGARPLAQGPMLATGESIGSTLPCTGEGIGKAMASGAIAAEAIDRYLSTHDKVTLTVYPHLIDGIMGPQYKGYATAQKLLSMAPVNDVLSLLLQRNSFLRERITEIIAETQHPFEAFAPAYLLKALQNRKHVKPAPQKKPDAR